MFIGECSCKEMKDVVLTILSSESGQMVAGSDCKQN